MPAEFEKIVLEKFDDLNSKITGLSEEVHELKEKVDINTNSINNLTEKVENNTVLINNLSKKVENNTALINNLSKDVRDTQDILKIQSQNLAHFEHECMLKLNTLFDSFVANSEEHAVFSKFIAQLNAESFDYRQRISKLEEHFINTKILATN